MDRQTLLDRTKQFALRCLKLADGLPRNPMGRIISNQLGRCGSSVGANYRAACRARSRRDFINKIGIVEEEADESAYWMELVIDSGLVKPTRVEPLKAEAIELVKVMVASARTARSGGKSIRNPKSEIRNS